MAIRVRAACIEEHEALDQLMRRAARSFSGISDELLDHPKALRVTTEQIEAGRVLLAESGGTIAGFAIWRPIGDTTAELEGMFVDPDLWGRGIGAELLQAVCDTATASGLRNMFAIAIPEAADFYRHAGFGRTGARSTPMGPALTMMKEIGEH